MLVISMMAANRSCSIWGRARCVNAPLEGEGMAMAKARSAGVSVCQY